MDYVSKEGKRPSTSLKIGGVNFGSGTEVDGISIVDRSESVQLRDLRSGSVFVFRKYRYVSRSSSGHGERCPFILHVQIKNITWKKIFAS